MNFSALILFLVQTASAANLIWEKSPSDDGVLAVRYNVYVASDATEWKRILTTRTNFAENVRLFPGSNYFVVTASRLNGADESVPSNTLGIRGYHFERMQVQQLVIGQ